MVFSSFGKRGGGGGSDYKPIKIRPTSFFSDFGDVRSSLSSVRLKDKTPEAIKQGMTAAGLKERDILQGLPTSMSPEEAFNNPFSDALRQQLLGDFETRAQEQNDNLKRSLAARNSLDNSAGILAQMRQQEAQNRTRSNVDAQAALGGFDAYTQNLGNMLSVLQNVQRSRLANMEQALAPAKLAAGFQSAINPLITADANARLMEQQRMMGRQGGRGGGLFSSIGSLFGLA